MRSLRVRVVLGLVTGPVVGGIVGMSPVLAGPAPLPACGDSITTDVVLSADLHCPSGNGLVVEADDVTVDLGGHRLTGSITGTGVSGSGVDGMTVRNGTIGGFASGVTSRGGADATVEQLTIELLANENSNGVALAGTTSSRVTGNRLEGGGVAILVVVDPVSGDGADGNRIEGNVIESSEEGILIDQSDDNVVVGNTSRRHAAGIVLATESRSNHVVGNDTSLGLTGIYVDNTANADNHIERNTSNENTSAGIFIDLGQSQTTLAENRTDGNDVGIRVRSVATTITRNEANDNTQLGIDAVAGVIDGGGNRAAGNGDPRQCVGVVCNASAPSTVTPPVQEPSRGVARTAPAARPVAASPRFTG
jgi:parallel beta-helix repeat protein